MRISTVVLIAFAVVSWGVYFRSNANLTHEETVILRSAAVNDSMIVWTKFNGVLVIDIEGTDLVPNQAPTTTNAWMDAINRLEARGYITNEGLKVGCYVLTDTGKARARKMVVP
ncbi:MAG: hypothetical protein AAGI63_05200 [Planctomycetota bacterium]